MILPERSDDDRRLNSRAWVEAVRRPTPQQLRERVADHLAQARELGEV